MGTLLSGGVVVLTGAIVWLTIRGRGRAPEEDGKQIGFGQISVLALVGLFHAIDLFMLLAPGGADAEAPGRGASSLEILQHYILTPVILGFLLYGLFIHRRRFGRPDAEATRPPTAERDAEFERQRMEDFANAASDWFWETDADHRYTWFSERVEEFTKFPREWHYGKSREEILLPGAPEEQWLAHLDDLKNHRAYRNFEFSRQAPDGVKWIRSSGVPVFDRDGVFCGYWGTGTDISEVKRVLAEHRQVEDNFRSVIEHSIQGILVLDGLDLVFANKALAGMFGFKDPEEVLESGTLEHLVDPGDFGKLKESSMRIRDR